MGTHSEMENEKGQATPDEGEAQSGEVDSLQEVITRLLGYSNVGWVYHRSRAFHSPQCRHESMLQRLDLRPLHLLSMP